MSAVLQCFITGRLAPFRFYSTDTIDRIARKTEDKDMYDLREKRLRDQRWMINSSIRQGLKQGLEQDIAELQALAAELEKQVLKKFRG